ncbi:carbohydrate esterase family 5 protein [Xylariomycetidae sp. FL2044]|nr:carbohydrate esterase family 5 protein [Xylariomycetidae sp. FL2044]
MISLLCWLVVLGAAAALPTHLQSRQDWSLGYYSYELSTFGCKPVIFVFAKATYEPGNIGNTVGPHMSDGLKAAFGVRNVVTQGVDYWGFMETNFYPGGAPPWGIYDMQLLLTAAAACPDSKIVASGYSQGAALVHRAIEGLSEEVKSKIAGVVTFGDTQTYQDGGRIKGYPQNDTLIICNVGDVICTGTLYVFPIHFDYVKWVPTAVLFLTQKLLQANEEHPWPDDAFAFPGITTTTTTLAPQPSVPYTLPTGKPTGKPTWRPSTPAISGLPTPPTPGFPIPTAPESLTPELRDDDDDDDEGSDTYNDDGIETIKWLPFTNTSTGGARW